MNSDCNPPPVLGGGRLLAYTIVDDTMVHHAPGSTLYVDGKMLGRVPRLAISEVRGETLLLFCDEDWGLLGVISCTSVGEAQQRAESEYPGITERWVEAHVSEEAATRHLEEEVEGGICSFCGRPPERVQRMFERAAARICDTCVTELFQDLQGKLER